MKIACLAAPLALVSFAVSAQDTIETASTVTVPDFATDAAPAPIQAVERSAMTGLAQLPANTEIALTLNQDVTTKGKTWSAGDQFDLSVADDVMLGNFVVIPRGTKGVGRITWMTDKGMLGKSGKMDIELIHLELSNRRIPISGTYRQEGEGNTLATVGSAALAGPFAVLVTGRSALIPQGRELKAHTNEAISVQLPASAVQKAQTVQLAPSAGAAMISE